MPSRAQPASAKPILNFLYAWLREAIGRWCVVSPEFPTGNGKVDIHLRCRGKEGLIEVKSYSDQLPFKRPS